MSSPLLNQTGSPGSPERAGPWRRLALGASHLFLAVAISAGILVATGGLWRPLLEENPNRLTDVLTQTIETRGIEAAVAQYKTLRERGFEGLRESESDTNRLGYQLLRKGDKESAIRVFELNVETHPESANVYDSLAEAYDVAGLKGLAIANYQKAVAVDPKKKTAVSALQRLTNSEAKPYRPMVLFHIFAGTVGLLAGAAAMSLRKGSRWHGGAGNVFFVSMLSMATSAVYMASMEPDGEVINVLMGLLTFYLVATAWVTARRKKPAAGIFDWGALLVVCGVAAGLASNGLEAGNSPSGAKDGIAAGFYLFFGAVALLAAGLDLRMIARGGVLGAQRIARHLWRMCGAMLIAVMSLFLGQPQVFPEALRNSGLLAVPGVLVLIFLGFWLIRVLFAKAFRRIAAPKPIAQEGI